MIKNLDFIRPITLPQLSRKIDEHHVEHSIGLADWSKHIHSVVGEKGEQFNDYVEVIFVKGTGGVKYEIIESEREVTLRYYWDDFDKRELVQD